MSDKGNSVLRRLSAPPPADLAMTVARAAETAVIRALQDRLALPVSVRDVIEDTARAPDLAGAVPEDSLMLVLTGPGGRAGAAILDSGIAAALVETRLTGKLAETAPEARVPTAVDSDLLGDILDTILGQFGDRLSGVADGGWARGFSVSHRIDDPRLYQFALPEGVLRALTIHMDLGGGSRGGEVRLLMPPPGAGAPAGAQGQAHGAHDWSQTLKAGVLRTDMAVQAVLTRQSLTLATVAGWQPGDLVPVAGTALNEVRIEAAGRTVLAQGRLGQASGQRAVRLHAAIQAEGLAPPRAAALPATEPAADDTGAADTQGT